MYAFLFVEFLLGFLTMADFPPNLEDGEQWIPSDIYQEILYGSFQPKAIVDNISQEGASEVSNQPIESSFGVSSQVETFEHGGNRASTEQNYLWPAHWNGEELKGFAGSSGGTGVFLPQTAILKESNETKGTGVFLQSFSPNGPTTTRKNKKCGKHGKMFVAKKGSGEKKEPSQVPAEISLPAEWTY